MTADEPEPTPQRVRITTRRPAVATGDFNAAAHQLHALRRPERRRSVRVVTVAVITLVALFVILIARLQ